MRLVAMLLMALATSWPVVSVACTPVRFESRPYARGDLLTQYALHADVIQVVRAHQRRILADQEGGYPSIALFDFEVLQTLASLPFARADTPFSLRAETSPVSAPAVPRRFRDATIWPVSRDLYYLDFALNQSELSFGVEASLGFANYCGAFPYRIAEGDVFLALRRNDGALYRGDPPHNNADLTMHIDEVWAPSLVRLRGADDPMIGQLRARVDELRSERGAMARSYILRRVSIAFGAYGGSGSIPNKRTCELKWMTGFCPD